MRYYDDGRKYYNQPYSVKVQSRFKHSDADPENFQFLYDLIQELIERIKALEEKYVRYHKIDCSKEETGKPEKIYYEVCSKCGVRLEK